ncbi:MAG: lipoyl(octanoyl) transferase LipB [Bacteroidales bacterium]|nr:lipoyl(octanoyl) transferase LipB [Bacteroidales bacterium]
MNKNVNFNDLGLIDYKECWDYQEELFSQIINIKMQNRALEKDGMNTLSTPNHLLFCEHPHVFTLGKSGSENNLLLNFLELNKINASFYKINRGGDITYHGPGQIVGYPVFDMENFGLDVRNYIHGLEEAVIRMLKHYNVNAYRLDKATGVWLDVDFPNKTRKICAIGVKASRYVAMHGFALNINTDLKYFSYINPCGFIDKGVTSLEKEVGERVDIENVKNILKNELSEVFGMDIK